MSQEIRTADIASIGLAVSDPNEEILKSIGDLMVSIFRHTGFAYLKNHGIASQLTSTAFQSAGRFFSMDLEQKMDYERFVTEGYNGYTPPGGENTGYANAKTATTDMKECFDLCVVDNGLATAFKFDKCIDGLAVESWRLVKRLLQALDLALGADGQLLHAHSHLLKSGSFSTLRLLNYPPLPPVSADSTGRCAPHTDYGTLTLLFQDDEGGLEVETSPGCWSAASPIADTILVNIGDMMEIWTSGSLKATLHRVVTPEQEERRRRARQSIAFFVHPDNGVSVSPLNGDTRQYQPVVPSEFVQRKFAATYPAYKDWLRENDRQLR